jgi:hypothetical protein
MTWFNAAEHDPTLGAQGMPVGKYPVVITNSGVKASNNDPNSGLVFLACSIIDGPMKGQSGQLSLNLFNKNDTAREIAARYLSAICHAIGTHQLNAKPECVELWNKPFVIEMAPQKNDSKYTELVGVFDMAGNAPTKGQAAVPSSQQPPQQFAQQPAPVTPTPSPAPAWAGGATPSPAPAWAGGATPSPAPAWAGGATPTPHPVATATQPAGGQQQPSWSQQPQASATPSWQR